MAQRFPDYVDVLQQANNNPERAVAFTRYRYYHHIAEWNKV